MSIDIERGGGGITTERERRVHVNALPMCVPLTSANSVLCTHWCFFITVLLSKRPMYHHYPVILIGGL